MQLAFCVHPYTDAGRWEAVGNDVSWEGGDLWVLKANSTRQKLGFATVTHKLRKLGLHPAYTATHREPREAPLGIRDTPFHAVPQGPRLMASRSLLESQALPSPSTRVADDISVHDN